jgi:hypothetical protein
MPHELELLRNQMERLEHQLRWFKIAAVVLAVLATVFVLAPRPSAQEPGSMRVRQLIVEDANGRPRVVLGPLDAPGNYRRIGMRINDPNGAERFGVSYMEDGVIGLGLDAPPGRGTTATASGSTWSPTRRAAPGFASWIGARASCRGCISTNRIARGSASPTSRRRLR